MPHDYSQRAENAPYRNVYKEISAVSALCCCNKTMPMNVAFDHEMVGLYPLPRLVNKAIKQ